VIGGLLGAPQLWAQTAASGPSGTEPTVTAPASAPAAPAPASAEVRYIVDSGAVIAVSGDSRTRLSIPAPVLALYSAGGVLYVARGARGVAVYDVTEPLAPKLVREIPLGSASATGFHVVDDQLWVIVEARSMVPLPEAGPTSATGPEAPQRPRAAAQPVSPPPPPEPAASREVAIRRVGPGTVELGIGAEQGVRVGDRFAILRRTPVVEPDSEVFAGEELVTVAQVVAVNEDSSLAEVGRAAVVRTTDRARRAKGDDTDSEAFPARVPDVGEVSLMLRPLVNIGTPLGVGMLTDLEATYWGSAYFAGLRIEPLGLGLTGDGNIVSTAALAEGGYDGRAFAVGLGVGLAWVNGDLDHMLGSSDFEAKSAGNSIVYTRRQATHTAFALSQVARLGARDGLSLSVYNVLLLHRKTSDQGEGFIYGGTTARLLVPTGRRTDFLAEGGGGIMGYWFAGIGVATWLVGNGSPGSWRLSVSAGAAGIIGSREISVTSPGQPTDSYAQDISIAGPMVSLGVARRFEF
jgi:hypothetical protein